MHAEVREIARAKRQVAERPVEESEARQHALVEARRRRQNELREQRVAEEARLQSLREQEQVRVEQMERERQARWLSRPAPAPDPQPFGVSHEGAEHLTAAWMRHLGVLDAAVTQFTGDGGIDVESSEFIVQFKNFTGSVPVGEVRSLFGVAAADAEKCLLFTSGTITSEGVIFADRVGMALVRYDAVAGSLAGINELGLRVVEFSVPEAFDQ